MARPDIAGFFWDDTPPPKPPKKEKRVAVPPKPVWLEPGYLPYYDEAYNFVPDLFTDEELIHAAIAGERLVWDIECYPNYFCVAFESVESGKQLIFQLDDTGRWYDPNKLKWVLETFLLVDFYGEGYDKWIAAVACAIPDCHAMYLATVQIIEQNERPYKVLKSMKVKQLNINHIDVIELTPLSPSLKNMAGRLDSELMMDLPFKPGTILSEQQKIITRWYCFNDLSNTKLVLNAHKEQITIREEFGKRYGIDLRSHSDAQIAEAVFRAEVKRLTGREIRAGSADVTDKPFRLMIPSFIKFETENLQWVLGQLRMTDFRVQENGYIALPDWLKGIKIPIGGAIYRMGIGGLHSSEKKIAHFAGDKYLLRDFDVASYYPKLIMMMCRMFDLAPSIIGDMFLAIYSGIVSERLAAKAAKNKKLAEVLKIVVNGTFGKTLDPWSVMYCPQLGMQTTVIGQLCLLMAIERLSLAGLEVINANTDGIVVKCPIEREADMMGIFKQWEKDTTLEMETTDYKLVASRDVNNYIAVYTEEKDGKWAKSKGIFTDRGVKKNTWQEIVSEAVVKFMVERKSIRQTITECQDIGKFVMIRKADGGAVKVWENGQIDFVGKFARWYYGIGEKTGLVTAKKGHAVGASDGAIPIMRYPKDRACPPDLDRERYISEAYSLLEQIGYADLAQLGIVPPYEKETRNEYPRTEAGSDGESEATESADGAVDAGR